MINHVSVFSDPLEEADNLLEDFIRSNMSKNASAAHSALPTVVDDVELPPPSKLQKR